MIRKGEVHMMKEIMTKSSELGMQTFDQALFKLYRDGEISYESALAAADSANDLRLLIKLSGGEVSSQQKPHGLSLEANEDDTGISLNT